MLKTKAAQWKPGGHFVFLKSSARLKNKIFAESGPPHLFWLWISGLLHRKRLLNLANCLTQVDLRLNQPMPKNGKQNKKYNSDSLIGQWSNCHGSWEPQSAAPNCQIIGLVIKLSELYLSFYFPIFQHSMRERWKWGVKVRSTWVTLFCR